MICGNYIKKCMFMNPSAKRLTLVPNAIPKNILLDINQRNNDSKEIKFLRILKY